MFTVIFCKYTTQIMHFIEIFIINIVLCTSAWNMSKNALDIYWFSYMYISMQNGRGGGGICYNVISETLQFFLLGTTYFMYRHNLRGNYEFDCGQYNETFIINLPLYVCLWRYLAMNNADLFMMETPSFPQNSGHMWVLSLFSALVNVFHL